MRDRQAREPVRRRGRRRRSRRRTTRALGADPVSAYGGVVVLNRPVSAELAERIAEQFVEVLFAPGYEDGALDVLRAKEALRILDSTERRHAPTGERDYRRVLGGLLAQDRDGGVEDREGMVVVCGEPDEPDWGDLLFAWRVCKHVTSNAIVIAKDLQTIGIGAGQMSRVDAVRIAVEKAREHGHDLAGAVLASDAFFPFPDGPALGARSRRHARSSSRAARSGTPRWSPRSRRPARRWSSPAVATSATEGQSLRGCARSTGLIGTRCLRRNAWNSRVEGQSLKGLSL